MINVLADYTYNTTTTSSAGLSAAILLPLFLVAIAAVVVLVAGMWKTFTKAGKPGWASIVPFYNVWILAEVAGKPGWWGLLPLISVVPVVGWIISVIVSIILALGTARNFGKSDVFGVVGLWLFSPIGYCILGFGDAKYKDNTGTPTVGASPPVAHVS